MYHKKREKKEILDDNFQYIQMSNFLGNKVLLRINNN